MGIKIVSQPVGAPILAAAATAVGQAQERRSALQARMFQDEQRRKAIQEERQADREFTLERDKTAAEEAEKRRQADVAEFDRRDAAYRRKDALGAMYDEVARREKFYSSTPLTPEGAKQRDEAAASLRYIRERQAAGDRPDIIQQYMAQWIAEFDNRNPSAWEDRPKPTIDEFSKNSMYAGPDGRLIPNDSVLSGGAVPGYSRTMDPSTGKWGPWEKWAGAGGVDDKEAGAKLKWAQDQVKNWISENDMGAGINQEAYDKMLREQLNEYDRLQGMVRSGAYKDGAQQPAQPAPQQPGQPQPVPGDGQQLPVPAAPYQPPAQPLNAGDVVLPGGPSQLAPPPRDYAAEVAAQQAQYGGGQPAVQQMEMRTDANGRRIDENGNPITGPVSRDAVLRYDAQGRVLDENGNPRTGPAISNPVIRYDANGNRVDENGKPITGPQIQTMGAQLNPDDAVALVQRARAMDPQNAQMYDKADALFKGKPREQWTEDDMALFFDAYRRAWTAGLTQ